MDDPLWYDRNNLQEQTIRWPAFSVSFSDSAEDEVWPREWSIPQSSSTDFLSEYSLVIEQVSNPTAAQTVKAIQTCLKLCRKASRICIWSAGSNVGIRGMIPYASCRLLIKVVFWEIIALSTTRFWSAFCKMVPQIATPHACKYWPLTRLCKYNKLLYLWKLAQEYNKRNRRPILWKRQGCQDSDLSRADRQ